MSQTSETSEARGGSFGVAENGVDDWENSGYDSEDDYNDQLDDTIHAIQLGDDSPEYWEMREYHINAGAKSEAPVYPGYSDIIDVDEFSGIGHRSMVSIKQEELQTLLATPMQIKIEEQEPESCVESPQALPENDLLFSHSNILKVLRAYSDKDSTHTKFNYAKVYRQKNTPIITLRDGSHLETLPRQPFCIFNHILSPNGPSRARADGTIFGEGFYDEYTTTREPIQGGVHVFMRRHPLLSYQYEYCGLYDIVPESKEICGKKYANLPPPTRTHWVEKLCDTFWGRSMLRARGLTDMSKKGVDRALRFGRFGIKVHALRCVGYDQKIYDALKADVVIGRSGRPSPANVTGLVGEVEEDLDLYSGQQASTSQHAPNGESKPSLFRRMFDGAIYNEPEDVPGNEVAQYGEDSPPRTPIWDEHFQTPPRPGFSSHYAHPTRMTYFPATEGEDVDEDEDGDEDEEYPKEASRAAFPPRRYALSPPPVSLAMRRPYVSLVRQQRRTPPRIPRSPLRILPRRRPRLSRSRSRSPSRPRLTNNVPGVRQDQYQRDSTLAAASFLYQMRPRVDRYS